MKMKVSELAKFEDVINKAREMWKERANEYFEKHGDVGSCVLGAGICIYAVPPRCRNEKKISLIPSHEVARCQGSLHWEHRVNEVVDFLKANGLERAYFDYGMMD